MPRRQESLLGDSGLASAPIVVPGRGSKLLGGGLRSELTREEVASTLVEGFFPEVPASARPAVRARAGLTQIGLPYAADAAITRHLAAFLGRQVGAVEKIPGFTPPARHGDASDRAAKLLHPTAVLFNGGVMKGSALAARVVATLNAWLEADGAPPARVLEGADLDLAVARGAASYGLARHGRGLRIRGGTARAYYVGIEAPCPPCPASSPDHRALPRALRHGRGHRGHAPPHELGLVVGEPVRFRFFGSSVRRDDKAGTELDSWKDGELSELSPIEITLPAEGRREGDVVPVKLHASVTEIGTLLLEAIPREPQKPDERWKIELGVRSEG